MKKTTLLILSMILALASVFMLAACDEHLHTGEEWKSDHTHHYHVCDTCNEAFATEEHDFEDSIDGLNTVKTCKVCGYSYVAKEVEQHEHTFEDKLSHNEAFHFKACTFTDCPIQSEKAEHNYATPDIVQEANKVTKAYKCQTCEYERVEVITIESVINDESSWNLAFDNLELENFEMIVSFKAPGQEAFTNECIVTEDGCYVIYNKSSTRPVISRNI